VWNFADLVPDFVPIYNLCQAATMTSGERMYVLDKAAEYALAVGIPGDSVECSV
jgi:hypothetical protein